MIRSVRINTCPDGTTNAWAGLEPTGTRVVVAPGFTVPLRASISLGSTMDCAYAPAGQSPRTPQRVAITTTTRAPYPCCMANLPFYAGPLLHRREPGRRSAEAQSET